MSNKKLLILFYKSGEKKSRARQKVRQAGAVQLLLEKGVETVGKKV